MLKKDFDLTLNIHSLDDEFWIQFSQFPTLLSTIRLSVQSLADASIGVLRLTEMEVTLLNTEAIPCKEYDKTPNPHTNFVACSKNYLRSMNIWSKLKCLMPIFLDLVPDKKLKNCSDAIEAKEAPDTVSEVKWSAGQVCNDIIKIV